MLDALKPPPRLFSGDEVVGATGIDCTHHIQSLALPQ
jgi:hypothetical protein